VNLNPLQRELDSGHPGEWDGRRSPPGSPLLCSDPQCAKDVVDRRSLERILIPTRRRHIPQLLSVATGDDEIRFLRSRALNDLEHRRKIIVLVEWDPIRQDLEPRQRFGLVRIEKKKNSPRRLSSPSNRYLTFLLDRLSWTRTFPDPEARVGTSAGCWRKWSWMWR